MAVVAELVIIPQIQSLTWMIAASNVGSASLPSEHQGSRLNQVLQNRCRIVRTLSTGKQHEEHYEGWLPRTTPQNYMGAVS